MTLLASLKRLSSSILLLSAIAEAAPTNNYPLAIQYPPIIKYGQSYSYQIPSDTFISSASSVEYSASDLPDWLSFDSDTRIFSGVAPTIEENDGNSNDTLIWFSLIGTDTSGETSVNSSFLLTDMQVESVLTNSTLSSILDSSIGFQNSDSIVLTPEQSFRIKFPSTLFKADSDANPITYYTALTQSHTPLPIWISFNSQTFELSGTTPSLSSDDSIESFPVSILAIQSHGFTSASIDFNLTVSAHTFTTDVFFVNKTVNRTESFSYELPLDKIFLDNSTLSPSNISTVSLNTTGSSWLSANFSTLYGTVPTNFNDTAYQVTIESVYASNVSFTLMLHRAAEVVENSTIFSNMTTQLVVNATTGEYFQYKLPTSVVENKNATIDASYSPEATWLVFHSDNYTFNGFVPDSFEGTTVTLTGEYKTTKETFEFSLNSIQGKTADPTTSATPSSTASATEAATSTAEAVVPVKKSSNKLAAILCGVLIPVFFIIGMLLLLFFFCRRRKKTEKKVKISNPVINPGDGDNHRIYNEKDVEAGGAHNHNYDTSFSSDNSSTPFMNPQVNYSIGQMPSRKSSFGNMLEATPVGTPVPSLSHKKSFGTPTMATEYNLFKLDNPNKPFVNADGSPMSNAYSEGYSSEGTHVGENSGDSSGTDGNTMGTTQHYPGNVLSATAAPDSQVEQTGETTTSRPNSRSLTGLQPQLEISSSRDDNSYVRSSIISTHSSIAPASSMAMAQVVGAAANESNNSDSSNSSSVGRRSSILSNNSEGETPGKPRNSWRQTYEPGRRWHSRQQGGSLATISTDELYSVKLVNDDPNNNNKRGSAALPQSQSINSIYSSVSGKAAGADTPSPILRRLGSTTSMSSERRSHSNSTSIGSSSFSSESPGLGGGVGSDLIHSLEPPFTSHPSGLDTVPESPHIGISAPSTTTSSAASTPVARPATAGTMMTGGTGSTFFARGSTGISTGPYGTPISGATQSRVDSELYQTASSDESGDEGNDSDSDFDESGLQDKQSTPRKNAIVQSPVAHELDPGFVFGAPSGTPQYFQRQSIATTSSMATTTTTESASSVAGTPRRTSFYTKESQVTDYDSSADMTVHGAAVTRIGSLTPTAAVSSRTTEANAMSTPPQARPMSVVSINSEAMRPGEVRLVQETPSPE